MHIYIKFVTDAVESYESGRTILQSPSWHALHGLPAWTGRPTLLHTQLSFHRYDPVKYAIHILQAKFLYEIAVSSHPTTDLFADILLRLVWLTAAKKTIQATKKFLKTRYDTHARHVIIPMSPSQSAAFDAGAGSSTSSAPGGWKH